MFHGRISPASGRAADKRREPRLRALADVALQPEAGDRVEARLVNVSSCGFMAECNAALAPGSRVRIGLPGAGPVDARIVWCRAGRLGGAFEETVDPLQVLHAIGMGR